MCNDDPSRANPRFEESVDQSDCLLSFEFEDFLDTGILSANAQDHILTCERCCAVIQRQAELRGTDEAVSVLLVSGRHPLVR